MFFYFLSFSAHHKRVLPKHTSFFSLTITYIWSSKISRCCILQFLAMLQCMFLARRPLLLVMHHTLLVPFTQVYYHMIGFLKFSIFFKMDNRIPINPMLWCREIRTKQTCVFTLMRIRGEGGEGRKR